MPKSYRIRTEVGQNNTNKSINVNIDQDFDFLEILSLKILQSDLYIRKCSDYGVLIGRISVNNGYGVPNAKVSVFIPLSDADENNPIISELYPYKNVTDLNEDGYRYNLLPYQPSYPGHLPTGTFPDRVDVLTNNTVIELYDKYYKFTVQTNSSGDFMIFGVPIGNQTLVVDIDLSDIGQFSLSPQDLIRSGLATELQVDGVNFKTSENLNSLPQIINIIRDVEVLPLWGDEETCQASITRTDFDLTDEANIEIKPTAIFMGSLLSTPEKQAQKKSCKVKGKMGGQCSLIAGPGQIRAIRQTIFTDSLGRPALETYNLENNGNVIDDNGTWLTDIPMNLDYVTTNEFGEQVYSNDPKIGIPSTAKYRFKVKWQQSPTLGEPVKRGYFLVPNIREHGWVNSGVDPATPIIITHPSSITFAAQATQPQSPIPLYNNGTTGQVVFKITEKLNIASLLLTVNGTPIQGDNVILNAGDTLFCIPVYQDLALPCSFKINVITYDQYQLERSYSFSLSWDDYADENAGINCEDTFYEMKYNKVYTTSQLVDQYRKGFANNKFIGIKEITDDTCDGEVYKFPTNDGVYRNDILYLLFSLMMLIFKPILYVLLIVSHVVAFLLKYVMYPLVIVIAVIFVIVILICNIVNGIVGWFGGSGINCPDGGDLMDLIKDLLNLWKKMIIRLPNMTYPDCDFCECVDQDAKEFPDDQYQQSSSELTQNVPSGLPADFSNSTLYEGLSDYTIVCGADSGDYNWVDTPDECRERLIAAQSSYTGVFSPDDSYGGVGVVDTNNPDTPRNGWLSTTLPIVERVNLWNAKAKYFNDNISGEGYNRIKVSFQPTSNLFHNDNVTILIIDKNQINSYPQGQLLSFQDPKKSKDKNVFSANTSNGNITGGTSMTGTSVPYNVSWANPDGSGNVPPITYNLNITGNTVTELKFPTDIEYFQVIKSMTLGAFSTLSNGGNPNSFFGRVFNQASYMNLIIGFQSVGWKVFEFNAIYASPLTFISDWQSLGVLIMVRGVDPHTPRIDCKYEIGNIFGLSDNAVTITGGFHPNIPIQGNYKCVQHNYISGNNDTNDNGYTTTGLYYPTFNQLNFPPLNFSSYTTNLHSYYVSTSNDSSTHGLSSQPGGGSYVGFGAVNSTNGRIIDNAGLVDTNIPPNILDVNTVVNCIGAAFTDAGSTSDDKPTSVYYHGGYLKNEKIDGCSYAHLSMYGLEQSLAGQSYGGFGLYHSPSYARSTTMTINHDVSGRYIMRSDRLPTSTYDYQFGGNYMALQQNPALAVFKFSDDGAVTSSGTFIGGSGFQPNEAGDNVSGTTEPEFVNTVLDSFSCGKLVPLGCYIYANNTVVIDDPANCQTKGPGNVTLFEDNCYVLVSKPLVSLIVDFGSLAEWTSRTKIMFGVCRDVLSHLFTNNWINGTLYAFSFKNDRLFDSDNIPYNESCSDTVIFHKPTQNYFYRSSPYDGTEFIGKNAPIPVIGLFGSYFGGNEKNLLFPTTMMDLGPRNEIAKYLSLTNEYNGYNVNKIPSTSFGDIDDILNLFIISRLANTSFLGQLLGLGGANILSYFTREKNMSYNYLAGTRSVKNKRMVDSDYAQLISINSEIGVAPFDSENYPNIPQPPPPAPNPIQQTIFFNGGNSADGVIGIFFSSDTQVRDYLSPRRTILSDSLPLNDNCSFETLPIKTQNVPFYQWKIEINTSDPNIFGTQKNYWYTDGISGGGPVTPYHQFGYQLQDRLTPNSRYFIGDSLPQTKYYKGYIYSVNANGYLVARDANIQNIWEQNIPLGEAITVGGPFYFYFGLKRGASAMDRFIQKWVDTDYIVD